MANIWQKIKELFYPRTFGAVRSKEWPRLRDRFIVGKSCAVCGKKEKLEVHHILPFHLFPEKELDENNLIVLCEGSMKCHFVFGHLGSYYRFNKTAVEDCEMFNKKIKYEK